MQLYTSPTTPFGRKAMLMLLETGLAGQTTLHEVSGTPMDPGSMPLDRNPLARSRRWCLRMGARCMTAG